MNILIIVSAKLIDSEMQSQFGEIPSVLTPLEGKTVLDILVEKNKEIFDKIYIIAYEKSEKIEEYILKRNLNTNIKVIV